MPPVAGTWLRARNPKVELPQGIPLYRLFNPSTLHHLYTASQEERDGLAPGAGYKYEVVEGFVLPRRVERSVPLFRLRSQKSGDHFYTTSSEEREKSRTADGYSDEGVVGYVFPRNVVGSTPLFRLFSRDSGDHFYTTSSEEREKSRTVDGYSDEGVACYVMTNPSLPENRIRLVRQPWSLPTPSASLLLPGVAIGLAGLIGGGLKVGGVEVPVLDAVWKSIVVFVVGVGLVVLSFRTVRD